MKPRGVIAAGHPKTAEAAADVLADGGNAFDAALAALGRAFPRHQPWPTTNMFFDGVHVAMAGAGGRALGGVGDPRRGGVAIVT